MSADKPEVLTRPADPGQWTRPDRSEGGDATDTARLTFDVTPSCGDGSKIAAFRRRRPSPDMLRDLLARIPSSENGE